jgi:hypothetical protein
MGGCEGGMRGAINVAVQEVGNVNATWPGQSLVIIRHQNIETEARARPTRTPNYFGIAYI